VVTKSTVDRAHAIGHRIRRLDEDAGRRDAVALGLVDALLERDERSLAAALDALRTARAVTDDHEALTAWIDAAISFAHWGLDRVASPVAVTRGTQAYDFMSALAGSSQLGSTELCLLLETHETQVSRTGRRLLEQGFVTRRKIGRHVFWLLTPRGRDALEQAPAAQRSSNSEFWQAALRRGFEAAAGDEADPRREVDPTRERVIKCTLELHERQGIQATTWPQIADKAAVPVETVKTLFPTLDDLVRSCGQHFMEGLQIPPPDRAPDVFAGATSENERIRRLIQTFFGAYERGADGLTAARRERTDVPALSEAMDALDNTLDSLVVEALRSMRPDNSSVASIRAISDVEVWRALRSQGATAGAAVDQGTAAVERWLAAHPAR
jgi:AcrR family transcriptional regulator/DNA-binding MarR family transcriptional regulator